MGLRSEEAVDASDVEAEILQAGLQGGDIVAVERCGQLVDQRARAQAVRRLFHGPVGGRTDDSVDEKPTLLLEGPYGAVEVMIEHGVGGDPVRTVGAFAPGVRDAVVQETETGQSAPNLSNGRTMVAVTESVHVSGPLSPNQRVHTSLGTNKTIDVFRSV